MIKGCQLPYRSTQCFNPIPITVRELSCVLTSRQVYLGIDIYPKSIFPFTGSTIALVRRDGGELRSLHFNHNTLKSVQNYRAYPEDNGATIASEFADLCFGID